MSGVEALYRSHSTSMTYDEDVALGAESPSLPGTCVEQSKRHKLLCRQPLRSNCQRQVKGVLRSVAARTTETVTAAIGTALHGVTEQDIVGWFWSRAAYAMQS